MRSQTWIDRIAIALALFALAAGVGMDAFGRSDPGIRLVVEGDRIVVWNVNPYSPAAMSNVQAGMVVVELNGVILINLPHYVYGNPDPTPNPVTGLTPDPVPTGIEPAAPTVAVDAHVLAMLLAAPFDSLWALNPADIATWAPDTGINVGVGAWANAESMGQTSAAFSVIAGIILLFLLAWWLGSGRAGQQLRELANPLALAVAAPFLLWPLEASWSPTGVAIFSVVMPLSMLPLAAALVLRLAEPGVRNLAAIASLTCAACAIAIGLGRLSGPAGAAQALPIAFFAGMSVAIPGVVAAVSRRKAPEHAQGDRDDQNAAVASSVVVRTAELAAAGITPFFAVSSAIGPFPVALPLWLFGVGVASRLTVRPLVRLAGRAQFQRDLVVAATEAERARVAANIHDDALQELTLLVRRLDAAGDAEGADIARGISDRLRAICGDLRLPILDDLGVGPALDWLVLRIERLADGEVRLVRDDGERQPLDVELAFFRIAQEALANAVKHGRPPIVVRYHATAESASLSIDDAGDGIPADAADRAEKDGHFGLLNMAQRAEGIGAILDIRRWPKGGTHLQLEWRAK